MADLAKLVVRLEAQSSQLLTELDKANKKLGSFEKATNSTLTRINKQFSSFGVSMKGVLGTFLAGVSFRSIITASAEAAKNFALLENAVSQAGAAAGGRTAREFEKVSKELQNVTTFSDDAIQNVQQLLLRFQTIRTDRFDDATKSVLNLAAALGTDLDGAAKLVGRALADPLKGMTALARAGVIFSEGQKKIIKNLVETGRAAEAQGFILDELEKRTGGAAEKLRDNFSGALEAVKNSLGDLLEVDGGLPDATKNMNELAKTLQDPAVKAGADALFSLMITSATKLVSLLGKTAAGVNVILTGGADKAEKLQKNLEFLRKERESILPFVLNLGGDTQTNMLFPKGSGFGDVIGPAKIDAQIKAIEAELNRLQGFGLEGIETAKTVKKAFDDLGGAFQLPDITVTDNTEELEKLRKKLEDQGKSLAASLRTPFENYELQIADADKLLKAHVITQETYARAVRAANDALAATDVGAYMQYKDAVKSADDELAKHLITQDVYQEKINAAKNALSSWTPELATYEKAVRDADDALAEGSIELTQWAERVSAARASLEGWSGAALEIFPDLTEEVARFDDALLEANNDMQAVFDEWMNADMNNMMADFEESVKEKVDETTKWMKRATENVQDILADGIEKGLTDGFDEGAKGMLKGMEALIMKMIAQAAAAQIGQTLFGSEGIGSGGGWLGTLGKAVAGAFAGSAGGGTMDQGGRGNANTSYLIGIGAQPERFVPDVPGHFEPAGMGGGTTIQQNFSIQAPQGTVSRATQQQVGAAAARGISQANRRGN